MTIYRYICGCGEFQATSTADRDYDAGSEAVRYEAYGREAAAHHAYCCEAQQRGEDGPCREAGGRDTPACPVYGDEVSA